MKNSYTRILALLLALLPFAGARAQCPTAACVPGTATNSSAPFIGAGIYQVRLGTAATFNGTGYAQGYIDSSCGRSGIGVIAGTTFNISITTGSQVQENVRVWLDANNDGRFDSAGANSELVFSSDNAFTHSGTIRVPSTALLNQKLRLRVATDVIVSALPTPCRTPDYGQTRDFYVMALGNTSPPIAAFSTPDSVTCSGTVSFTDQSQGAPTSWRWDFGDNSTGSTDQNPTHFYASSGTYSVKLVVRNANGADSITRPNLIRFNDTVPVAACTPATSAYCCGYGITRVRLSTLGATATNVLDKSSANGAAGYENFTCQTRVRMVQGKRYRLALTTNPSQAQATKAWIDANGNGTFEDAELVMNIASGINPADTFLCPAPTGAGVGKAVRLRIVSDAQGNAITGCGNPQLGQAEDYTLLLVENTLPPVAAFTRIGGSNCDSTYSFQSQSDNAISGYYWYFGDGSVDSTSGASATHTYASPGTYNVSLVVVGPFGRDTATLANAVTYVLAPAQALCGGPATTNTCCNIGIRNVAFGTISVSSGDATEGYQDFTCSGSTTVTAATPVPFRITTGGNQQEQGAVWVDLNNDLSFDPAEQLITIPAGVNQRSFTLTIPATAVQNVPLRVRVLAYAGRQTITDPCTTVTFGQYEDYAVVVLPNLNPPTANFVAASRTTCDGAIQFVDSSINALSYRWDFGDNTSDTVASPYHQYANPGNYTVRLIVTNAFGSDTLIRTNYITILPNVSVLAAPCQPVAQQTIAGFGITNVSFATINNTTAGSTDGYKDYTCTNIARIPVDTSFTFTVRTGGQGQELVAVWIDYDNNGQFDATNERVATGTTTAGLFTGTATFSQSATIGRALRMRVMSDLPVGGPGGTQPLTPCQTMRLGQVEDYTVIFSAVVALPPVAGFTATNRNGCSGLVQFRDSSRQFPSSRLWRFGDGMTDSTVSPTHQYTAAGVYTVTLIVRNSIGVDSLVRQNYVNYQPLAGLATSFCSPSYTTAAQNAGFRSMTIGTRTVIATTTTPASGTFQDVTCSLPAIDATFGDSVQIAVTSAGFNDQIIAWLDINNDGQFVTGEQVRRLSRGTGGGPTGVRYFGGFLVPNTVATGTPMRLRIVSATATGGGPVTIGYCAIMTAGQAVDVALLARATAPVASFTYAQTNGCGATVNFSQTSSGGPTSFHWDFGTGDTSDQASPQYIFPAPGTYSVTLIVSNALGRDTIVTPVTISSPPTAAVCQPVATAVSGQLTQLGMTRVDLVNQTTGIIVRKNSAAAGNEGFQDNVCTSTLTIGRLERMIVRMQCTTAPQNIQQRYTVFLDLNNDGDFTTSEQLGTTNGQGAALAQLPLVIPATANLGLLRMRIVGQLATAPLPSCNAAEDGQVEDYGIMVTAGLAAVTPVQPILTLAPNPAQSEVRITAELPGAAPAQLSIIDATGRTVLSRSFMAGSVSETIDLGGYPTGVYQVVLTQGKARALKRLVVER